MKSPYELSSFDPAIHLHSEQEFPSEYLDEIEAAREQQAELNAWKNKNGIVIQHRSWKTEDVFRSEGDRSINTPLKRRVRHDSAQDTAVPPSSPPILSMPYISSPVAYPPTSSPTVDSPRKKRKLDAARSPLKDVNANSPPREMAGFLMDDDSDDAEEDLATIKAAQLKRKKNFFSIPPTLPVQDAPVVIQKEIIAVTVEEMVDIAEAIPTEDSYGATEDPAADPSCDLPISSTPVPASSSASAFGSLLSMTSCAGQTTYVAKRRPGPSMSYEQLVASRSATAAPGRAQRSYYGIDIHRLMDEAKAEAKIEAAQKEAQASQAPVTPSIENIRVPKVNKKGRALMWTEKYRARQYTDLLGDETVHRKVLWWLKSWDPIVFPGTQRATLLKKSKFYQEHNDEQQARRKILLLTGPPGLGKTTLAHVCARQAGYEVHEINASDERSRDVVKGRIRDMVGTENVRGVSTTSSDGKTKTRKAGRPVCVVVDEVDGVVSGSGGGGGEGGFVKALLDLVALDAKNSNRTTSSVTTTAPKRKKKGENFRMLRPLILICNDVYAPALRPLRQSGVAEIVYMRKPELNMVITRMQSVFEREGIKADSDGVRKLCEATWGIGARGDRARDGQGEGDIRSVLVIGEWVASKLRASAVRTEARLTRAWVEKNMLADLAHGGSAVRNMGRGGAKEVVERVFLEGAGFPKNTAPIEIQAKDVTGSGTVGVAEATRRRAMERLREMIDASGEHDRVVQDCFSTYPSIPYQDTTSLTKPDTAYSWLHFHDTISSAVHTEQAWELAPYLSQSPLAFHHLFAISSAQHNRYGTNSYNTKNDDDAEQAELRESPLAGPNASWHASETTKANAAMLAELQGSLSISLARIYKSPSTLATELMPYILRILSPDVKPVIINTSTGGTDSMRSKNNVSTASVRKASEKEMVMRSVNALLATGVKFEKARVEIEDMDSRASGGWVLRMQPPLDAMGEFETWTAPETKGSGSRYGVRSVIAAEYLKEQKRLADESRRHRMTGDDDVDDDVGLDEGKGDGEGNEKKKAVKKDFFGRVIKPVAGTVPTKSAEKQVKEHQSPDVWVSFNEGYSNAVRKPLTIKELMGGF